jgi:hypothetical protein
MQSPFMKIPGKVEFHPTDAEELIGTIPGPNPMAMLGQLPVIGQWGLAPKYRNYHCGACGQSTNGRIVCDLQRPDGAKVCWCLCSCDKSEPSIIIEKGGAVVQIPIAQEFASRPEWPAELSRLFDEAARSYGAGAFTATALVCRKVLMACACQEGDTDGKQFVTYVDYITNTVLTFPKAKTAIDAIRTIGNDANHDVKFVSQADARRAMEIVTYLLNTVYSLPAA